MVDRQETHALKSKNYSNCVMLHPNGSAMFRCDAKKLNWYLSRDLAKIVCEDPPTAQFLFEPKGFGWAYDEYYLAHKKNICVVCGTEQNLTRHHVIPYCYRRYFPEEVKSHNSYDIVLLCIPHHDEYELEATELKKQLAIKHGAPLNGVGGSYDSNLAKANAFRFTLLKGKHDIPKDRLRGMLDFIKETCDEQDIDVPDELSIEDLKGLPVFNCTIRPHTQHGEQVAPLYDPDDFAIMWRKHFVAEMKPQHLPEAWKVERRIYEEARQRDVATSPDWESIKADSCKAENNG